MQVFIEPVEGTPTLCLFGAGHVSQPLRAPGEGRRLPRRGGGRPREVREPRALPRRGPRAWWTPSRRRRERLTIGRNTYAVVVTRGHGGDTEALAAVLGRGVRFVGLLGSRPKLVHVVTALEERGVPPRGAGAGPLSAGRRDRRGDAGGDRGQRAGRDDRGAPRHRPVGRAAHAHGVAGTAQSGALRRARRLPRRRRDGLGRRAPRLPRRLPRGRARAARRRSRCAGGSRSPQAVFAGASEVEGVSAAALVDAAALAAARVTGRVLVAVDPRRREPRDAAAGRRSWTGEWPSGTWVRALTDAPLVIGLGPGLSAPADVHAVVETQRGPDLGLRALAGRGGVRHRPSGGGARAHARRECCARRSRDGSSRPARDRRPRRARRDGRASRRCRSRRTAIAGMLRGMLADGVFVEAAVKIGDIDPRGRAVDPVADFGEGAQRSAPGALEAILLRLAVL